MHRRHHWKELHWPPLPATIQPDTSLHAVPPSSRDPVFITSGRPIVILPEQYIVPSGRNFHQPRTTRSLPFSLQPCSSPAPLITLTDNVPNKEIMPAVPICGAIEFSDVQQITPEPPEVKQHNKKEESSVCANLQQASIDINSLEVGTKLEHVSSIPSPTINDKSTTTLSEAMCVSEEAINSNFEVTLLKPTTECSEYLDHLQPPLQKSAARVSPLIMNAYEESKEELVLDDSDDELEIPECNNKSPYCPPQFHESERQCQTDREDETTKESNDSNDTSVQATLVPLPNGMDDEPKSSKHLENKIDSQSNNTKASLLVPHEPQATDSEPESSFECAPPLKRTKMLDNATRELDGTGSTSFPAKSNQLLDSDDCFPTQLSNSSNESFGQTVPDVPDTISTPLEASEPTSLENCLPVPLMNFPDHSLKLDYPHEPIGCGASDGKDTAGQTLPDECAREHAMVPNLVRCADEHREWNNDRGSPDDGNDGAHIKTLLPILELSDRKVVEDQQTGGIGTIVPELKTELQSPKAHSSIGSLEVNIPSDMSTEIPAEMGTSINSAQLNTEHQIVPDEPISNMPFSSQSLYADFDLKPEKHYPSVRDETEFGQLGNPTTSDLEMNSFGTRPKGVTYSPHSDVHTLLEFSPQQSVSYNTTISSGDGDCTGCVDEEPRAVNAYSRSCFGRNLFGNQVGRHSSQLQG